MTAKQFIENILIQEIWDIQRVRNHHYLSFGLISQGIEFLGACLDQEDFHKQGLGSTRFREAISQLFPQDYHPFNKKNTSFDLYTNLRCGLLHIFLPKPNLELIQQAELPAFDCSHLEFSFLRGNKRLLLVSEVFLDDFVNACGIVVQKIEQGALDKSKINGTILLT